MFNHIIIANTAHYVSLSNNVLIILEYLVGSNYRIAINDFILRNSACHAYICMYVCMYVYMYVYMYVCMYV